MGFVVVGGGGGGAAEEGKIVKFVGEGDRREVTGREDSWGEEEYYW